MECLRTPLSLLLLLLCSHCALRQVEGSWSSRRGNTNFPHDIPTKKGLTELYNQKVVKVEHVERPMGLGSITHEGTRVTTAGGERYLVHNGKGYGKSGQTVVVDAKHMSNNWKATGSRDVSGHTVSDFVKAGGQGYNLPFNNCKHSAKRMMNLGEGRK